jgi:type VI secretion system protein ImpL
MKRFLYILGAGLCVLVVLSALLFIQAQTTHFSEGAGERAPGFRCWVRFL